MGKRVVITKQKIKDSEYMVTALFEDHRANDGEAMPSGQIDGGG